jgi:hypothetical protein
VDNFANADGASTGIEWALERPIEYAINHNAKEVGHPSSGSPAQDRSRLDAGQ